jgi:hypothetical protein
MLEADPNRFNNSDYVTNLDFSNVEVYKRATIKPNPSKDGDGKPRILASFKELL